ncbi:MAG: hypothetical protein HY046_06120 [Acidobacteria bacterium]|nr:hypothetical protein [Acidobacteriota bacterium]
MPDNKTQTLLLAGMGVVTLLASAAAMALWLNRSDAQKAPLSSVASPTASNAAPTVVPNASPNSGAAPGQQPQQESQPSVEIFVNDRKLNQTQIDELTRTYGAAPWPGRYWYDSRSGLFGFWGREAAGYLRTGHNFGPLSPRASNGNTDVFINGREINMAEALFCQQLFGAVYRGKWWLDGNTGNLGMDGNPAPIANVALAMQQAQARTRGGGGDGIYRWRDGSGSNAVSDGKCFFMSVPGANVVSSPGC